MKWNGFVSNIQNTQKLAYARPSDVTMQCVYCMTDNNNNLNADKGMQLSLLTNTIRVLA